MLRNDFTEPHKQRQFALVRPGLPGGGSAIDFTLQEVLPRSWCGSILETHPNYIAMIDGHYCTRQELEELRNALNVLLD